MSTIDLTPTVDIRRAEDRFKSDFGWLDSKHSFSFGHHLDQANTHHGLLLVNNDDIVDPGTGFDTHPHRDMEIVTWVLEGSLVHQDSTGHNGVIYPGLAQRMSAGTGILHSEKNDSWRLSGDVHQDPVHFVQMWVVPDEAGITPVMSSWRSRRNCCPVVCCRSHRVCANMTATPRSGSGTRMRPCTSRGSPRDSRCPCPTRRSCTCSWPAAR